MLEQVTTAITSLVEARNQLQFTLSTLEDKASKDNLALLENQLKEINFTIKILEDTHRGLFAERKIEEFFKN